MSGYKNQNTGVKLAIFAILQQYSARSARQHKAWGVSPRIAIGKNRKNPRSGLPAERVTAFWNAPAYCRLVGTTALWIIGSIQSG